MKKQWLGLLLGPLVYFAIIIFGNFQGLPPKGQAVLAATAWMAIWWLSEAVPIAITALLPLVLFPLSGAVSLKETGASYGHPIIFLFVGGFMIATAVEKWGLHRRIALAIIAKIGTSPREIILGFMLATGFLSMWISNTATTIMMVPIGIAIISQLACGDKHADDNFGKALLLGIAYASSIGGIATLIGTPTNVIFTGVVLDKYGQEISFASWMLFAAPVSAFLLLICWYYLVNIGFNLKQEKDKNQEEETLKKIQIYQTELGPISYEEKVVLGVFGLVAFVWITRSFLLNPWIPALDDTIIALLGTTLLFIIPTSQKAKFSIDVDTSLDEVNDSSLTILDWDTAVKIPWGVILLFGGGLAMAAAFESSGLANWIGAKIGLLGAMNLFFLLLIVVAAVNFLTEVTSNVATVSMVLPILASLSDTIGIQPYFLMIGATCAASCAFMLPVATAPNAIVFGYGYIKIKDMVKAGIWLNIISIILFTIYIYLVLPLVLI